MRTSPLLVPLAAGLAVACTESGSSSTSGPPPESAQQVARPGSAPSGAAASRPAGHDAPEGGGAAAIPPAFPSIEGQIVLADDLPPDLIREDDVIFIMARTQDGGHLVATDIIEEVKMPASFRLDSDDIMVHGRDTHPPYMLSARLDRDRDAMTRGEDDLYAEHAQPLQGGESGIELVLAKKPKGADSPSEKKMPKDAIHGGGSPPAKE